MNVDLLKASPGWYWYPVIAAPLIFLALGGWPAFKPVSANRDPVRKPQKYKADFSSDGIPEVQTGEK